MSPQLRSTLSSPSRQHNNLLAGNSVIVGEDSDPPKLSKCQSHLLVSFSVLQPGILFRLSHSVPPSSTLCPAEWKTLTKSLKNLYICIFYPLNRLNLYNALPVIFYSRRYINCRFYITSFCLLSSPSWYLNVAHCLLKCFLIGRQCHSKLPAIRPVTPVRTQYD